MNTEFKKLFEIDRLTVIEKLKDMQEYFSITRNFSLKVSGHLKILVHLVNNLVISPDNLELIETELIMPKINTKKSSDRMNTTTYSKERNSPEKTESKMVIEMISNFKDQNDRLFKIIENGGSNADYIKTVVEKMMDTISQKDQKESENLRVINNHIQCPNCVKSTPININPQHCDHRYNCNCHTKSVYIPPQKEKVDYNNSVKSIQYKMEKMEDQIKRLSSQNVNDNEKIINELLRDKNENEEKIKDQEDQIKELIMIIKKSNKDITRLKDKINELSHDNKILEETLTSYLKNKQFEDTLHTINMSELFSAKQPHDDHKDNLIDDLNKSNKKLKEKIHAMKKTQSIPHDYHLKEKMNKLENDIVIYRDQNEDLRKENSNLLNLIKKERKKVNEEERFVKYDNIDFLKCVFVQASFIDEKNK
jgi:hypothetical protein